MGKMSVMIIDNNPENERNCVKFGENEKKKLATRLHNFIIIWNIFGIFAVIEKKLVTVIGAGHMEFNRTHSHTQNSILYTHMYNRKIRN